MIAIFAAMAAEVRACLAAVAGGRPRDIGGFPAVEAEGLIICQTGLGRRARDAAEAFFAHVSPTVVMSIGTAGGLAPNIDVGHLVFCERVGHESEPEVVSGDAPLIASAIATAEAQRLTARPGVSLTVDTVAWTPEAKARLRRNGVADVVEMESFWIGRAAAERDLPFLAARAVSDGPDNRLVEIPDLFDEHGNLKPASVVAFTRAHPELIPELAAQHARGGRALDSLSRFVVAFVPQLVSRQ